VEGAVAAASAAAGDETRSEAGWPLGSSVTALWSGRVVPLNMKKISVKKYENFL
jgi:hypothetical protein